jgi:sec-independent protein translocase protein TatB
MFPDLSWSHMLLVLVVALVVVGPKDLPKLMRTMGQWAAKARNMADQFRRSFDEMARQSELDELRKEIDELRNNRPLADVDKSLNETLSGPAVSLTPDSKAEAAEAAPEIAAEAKPEVTAGQQELQLEEPAKAPEHPAEPIPPSDIVPPQP